MHGRGALSQNPTRLRPWSGSLGTLRGVPVSTPCSQALRPRGQSAVRHLGPCGGCGGWGVRDGVSIWSWIRAALLPAIYQRALHWGEGTPKPSSAWMPRRPCSWAGASREPELDSCGARPRPRPRTLPHPPPRARPWHSQLTQAGLPPADGAGLPGAAASNLRPRGEAETGLAKTEGTAPGQREQHVHTAWGRKRLRSQIPRRFFPSSRLYAPHDPTRPWLSPGSSAPITAADARADRGPDAAVLSTVHRI